ncbi:hypothetical protein [Flavihumibacter petaseus]|uniref:hypothetical protein n=1 Tax=Flavihumibacter petaseus TaxID=549295 RepID=UPI00061D0517|nr:hypothetical protein [Flavihumibacter petaseus]
MKSDLQRRQQHKWIRLSLSNFLVLSLAGLLLRAFPLLHFPWSYTNLLHAHSHFAFGGWVLPALIFLTLKYFPEITTQIDSRHWRNILVLIMISAYGMLVSFFLQGYGPVSIILSALSLVASFYFGIMILRQSRKAYTLPIRFLKAGIIFCFISSLGPLALGPISALGKSGTPLYHNAIYFYLHFQYNGFFTFVVLAALYKLLEKSGDLKYGKYVYLLMTAACIPAYSLSVLWNSPSLAFNIIGGAAALLQLTAAGFVVMDLNRLRWETLSGNWLLTTSIAAFVLKNILQVCSAFPVIARIAALNRNYIIGYLHLVLLGFISTFIVSAMSDSISQRSPRGAVRLLPATVIFLSGFITTELMLVLQPSPDPAIMLGVSALIPVSIILMRIAAGVKDPFSGIPAGQSRAERQSTTPS